MTQSSLQLGEVWWHDRVAGKWGTIRAKFGSESWTWGLTYILSTFKSRIYLQIFCFFKDLVHLNFENTNPNQLSLTRARFGKRESKNSHIVITHLQKLIWKKLVSFPRCLDFTKNKQTNRYLTFLAICGSRKKANCVKCESTLFFQIWTQKNELHAYLLPIHHYVCVKYSMSPLANSSLYKLLQETLDFW